MLFEFFFSTPVATGLNLAIAVVTVASLLQAAHAFSRQVRRAERDLRQVGGTPDGDAAALVSKAKEAAAGGLVRKRLDALAQFKAHGQPVDVEMLAAISAEEVRDAAPLARWATTSLVLLGLSGTLLGLSLAVGELSGLLAPGQIVDVQEISQAILGTLAQMKVAFSTTLAGVGGAIVVGSAMAHLRHHQSRVVRELEEISTTQWVPLFQTTEESRMGDAVKELEETRKGLDDGLKKILGRVETGFRELSNQFGARSKALLDHVESLRDATLKVIGEREEGSLSLSDYVGAVQDTTDELQQAVQASADMLPEIRRVLEETIRSEQQSLATTLAAHTEALRPVLEEQQRAAAGLADAVGGELERMKELESVLERLTASFEAARATWEKADKSIEKMGRETRAALEEGLKDSLDAVTELTDKQSMSQERVMRALEGFQATHEETLKILADQSRRALNQSQEMVEEVRETLKESLSLVGDRLIQAQEGQGVKIESGLNALGRELRDLAAPAAAGGSRAHRSRSPSEATSRASGDGAGGNGPSGADGVDKPVPGSPVPGEGPSEATLEEIQEDLRGLE
jgi:hypothetical protein